MAGGNGFGDGHRCCWNGCARRRLSLRVVPFQPVGHTGLETGRYARATRRSVHAAKDDRLPRGRAIVFLLLFTFRLLVVVRCALRLWLRGPSAHACR